MSTWINPHPSRSARCQCNHACLGKTGQCDGIGQGASRTHITSFPTLPVQWAPSSPAICIPLPSPRPGLPPSVRGVRACVCILVAQSSWLYQSWGSRNDTTEGPTILFFDVARSFGVASPATPWSGVTSSC